MKSLLSLLRELPDFSVNTQTVDLSSIKISGIAYNSANAKIDTLFVCIPGALADGHDFANDAYAKGSRVFVCSRAVSLPQDAIQILTPNTRQALAILSAAFFDHPERALRVIGVTGTKGKSTVCEMIRHILVKNGISAGSVGTVGVRFGDTFAKTGNTTPESHEIFRIFAEMVAAGVQYAVLEVSSQGIKLDRIWGIPFFAAVMTNLSEDHIGANEHPNFTDYKQCKMALFSRSQFAVFNADDAHFSDFFQNAPCRRICYSTEKETEGSDLFFAKAIRPTRISEKFGTSFSVCHGKQHDEAVLPFPGTFSVSNALAAIAVCSLVGISPKRSCTALSDVSVQGRFEVVKTARTDVTFVIDYAHNGESLSSALLALQPYKRGRLICLFGSVGGRTELRRRELGTVAAAHADFSILTSDNPNRESPRDIIRDIEKYIDSAPHVIIPDRKEAIEYAAEYAQAGDIVLLAGKGHESYQLINGKKIPFSEKEILQNATAKFAESIRTTS